MAFTKATFDYLDSGGLINWQLTAKTATFDAVSGEGYLVDTSSAAVTVTLPDAPSAGDEIIIVDYASNAGTNNITLDPGTLNLRGATDDLVLSTNNQTARLLYSGATKGWLVTTEAGAGPAGTPALTVDYLVVAGGGGSSGDIAGGGGAGGLRTSYTNLSSLNGHTETSLSLSLSTDYIVTVGPGGTGTNFQASIGNNGVNSTFSTITSTGGGGGSTLSGAAANGGSGGGPRWTDSPGLAVTSPVTQGYNGGGSTPSVLTASGGGGANQVGQTGGSGSNTPSGDGGDGLEVNIVGGTGNYYAGGGGGGGSTSHGVAGGSGGTGGGGNGAGQGTSVSNGTPNTGGGGGGNNVNVNPGGNGGSGIVILRYSDAYTISETTSGGNVLSFSTDDITVPGTKITTFTAGDGTIQFST